MWRGAEQQPEPTPQDARAVPSTPSRPSSSTPRTTSTSSPSRRPRCRPRRTIQFWGIIVGLVAGPVLLLWLVMFRPDVSDWWTLGALGLTVGGFVLLVLRQPRDRDEDDPDNGARV